MKILFSDTEISISQILEEVEAYICTRCYHVLFCPITDEEVEDLSLQDRIRSLHWVTYGFLQTGLDFSNHIVKDRIDAAVTGECFSCYFKGPHLNPNSDSIGLVVSKFSVC